MTISELENKLMETLHEYEDCPVDKANVVEAMNSVRKVNAAMIQANACILKKCLDVMKQSEIDT